MCRKKCVQQVCMYNQDTNHICHGVLIASFPVSHCFQKRPSFFPVLRCILRESTWLDSLAKLLTTRAHLCKLKPHFLGVRHKVEKDHKSRQVQGEVRKRIKRRSFGFSAALVWSASPMFLSPVSPCLAGGQPKAYRRGTRRSSRCDLAWSPRRVGDPRYSHWRCTGLR